MSMDDFSCFVAETRNNAVTQHSRKLSQFASVHNDVSRYLDGGTEDINPQPASATTTGNKSKLAKSIMKDIDGDFEKQLTEELIESDAFRSHSRKKSQFDALHSSIAAFDFDTKTANDISRNVMKQIFVAQQTQTQKSPSKHNTNGNESIDNDGKTEDDENRDMNAQSGGAEEVDYVGVAALQEQKINYLESQLRQSQNRVEYLQTQMSELKDSKLQLAINANLCLNQMRELLLRTMRSGAKK